MCVLVAQSCPTLCDPMDCSPPGSSVHGILQARILEWTAISFSRGSSQPRDQTWVSCIAGRFFTIWVTRGALANSFSDPKGKTCLQSLRKNLPVHKASLEAPFLVLKTLFPSSWEIKSRAADFSEWLVPDVTISPLSQLTYTQSVLRSAGLKWTRAGSVLSLLSFLIYFSAALVFAVVHRRSSSCSERGPLSRRGALGASAAAEQTLGTPASGVAVHGFSGPSARGIFLDQGLNPCPLTLAGNSQPLDLQGSPQHSVF